MPAWTFILITAAAGGFGGAVNTFITERGFRLPWLETLLDGSRIWHPGLWGNVLCGVAAALLVGCVYGTLSQVSITGSYELTIGMTVGGIVPGMGGARILTAELDKISLNVTTQVVRFKVHSWLTYLHTGLCSSFSNLEP